MMFVYIMTNSNNTTLYVGVTNNLARRILEHKNNVHDGFTARYNLHKLVYYEYTERPSDAIYREKSLKKYYRSKKIKMITKMNPFWADLSDKIL